MEALNEKDLIYDWNLKGSQKIPQQKIEFDDETLRDGLQSPSVTDPKIEEKFEILHLMEELGIHTANIGLPGAGPRAYQDVLALAKEMADNHLKITPNCAARTLETDIRPIAEISQKVGIPIEACTFLGSSPIRQYAEEWSLDHLLKLTEDAVTFAVKHGLPVMFVTEDTTRARPDHLKMIYTTAVECGALRVCVCDTVGHATPVGARNLIAYVKKVVDETGEEVKVDWHGHRDRGLDIPNTISAIEAGADRVHGCAIGIGERVGNTPMDLLLLNLKLMGWIDNDLRKLPQYCRAVSNYCKVPLPQNYPAFGEDAFRTGTGVHAAAVIKAKKKGDDWLADRVYSGVPADMFGLHQKIEVGHMSGESNVVYWLESRGIEPKRELVKKIFDAAKECDGLLKEEEIVALVKEST
ncbi:2-isopropylmalate synthase [candidate division TA06 bacterium]|nr:2-isopropylmalate synthase [candidate division TA06 bacterium]